MSDNHFTCATESRERNGRKDEPSDDCQKTRSWDGADVTWRGSSFQTRAAATGRARSPTIGNRIRRKSTEVAHGRRFTANRMILFIKDSLHGNRTRQYKLILSTHETWNHWAVELVHAGNWQTGHIIHWRTQRIHLSVSAVVNSPPKGKCGRLPQHFEIPVYNL